MKDEEFKGFSSFDFFTMVFGIAVIVAISGPIIKKNFQSDNSMEVARRDLGLISQTILSPKALNIMAMKFNGHSADRAVASIDSHEDTTPQVDVNSLQTHLKAGEWEGEAGRDPWGNPYHFAFLRNKNGMPTHVAVWSDGPNQKNETGIRSQLMSSERPDALSFQGDDVGTVIPIR